MPDTEHGCVPRDEIFLWLSGAVEEDAAARIEHHVRSCATCAERAALEETLAAELCLSVGAVAPPDEVRSRLMARVIADQGREELRAPRLLVRRWRTAAVLRRLAVAASLVLAVGLGFASTYWLTPPWVEAKSDVRARELRYQAALARSEAQLRELSRRRELANTRLRGPEPSAASSVSYTSSKARWLVRDREGRSVGSLVCLREGLNCYLEASGVDRVGPSRVYVLWLKTDDGDLVSLGSFDADTSGNASFHTYADRELSRARRLMVTVEPWENWSSQPLGPVVFESRR
jgi:anti-sigma-K factor RskA